MYKANDLIVKGEAGKAVTLIKEVLQEDLEAHDEAYTNYLLGIARTKCVRFSLARQALEKAVRMEPRNAEYLKSLGWAKVMLGEREAGRNDLRQAISLDLVNAAAYLDIAVSYLHDFEFEECKNWLDRADALRPGNELVKATRDMLAFAKRDFAKLPKQEQKLAMQERNDVSVRQGDQMFMLQNYSAGRPMTRDEAEELKEEAKLIGGNAAIIKDDQEYRVKSTSSTAAEKTTEILEERKYIEKELAQLLKKAKSLCTVEDIKRIIWNEKDDEEFSDMIRFFDIGEPEELGYALAALNDAWNYFPHKCLGGLCPMEKILESQNNQSKIKRK